MNFFPAPSRRGFLQSSAAAISSFLWPRSLPAVESPPAYWFLNSDSGEWWTVADPVLWSLENACEPVLERATKRLLNLTPADGDRIIRLVTRRCRLNLLEVFPQQVVVQHWSQGGIADLRSFFKAQGIARSDVKVLAWNRKSESKMTNTGDEFLYGDSLDGRRYVLDQFVAKWHRRFLHEPDDWSAAPGTWSGYAWEGLNDNEIPWAAMKSAWRKVPETTCLNCDQPTLLANFGYSQRGMFNRCPRFYYVCPQCPRLFQDHTVRDVRGWIMANLDPNTRPNYDVFWGSRRKLNWHIQGDNVRWELPRIV